MSDIIINGLVKRRAEIAGEIEHAHALIRRRTADLEGLDVTIRLFDPDYKIDGIKTKIFRQQWRRENHGAVTRTMLIILRESPEPLTTRDIALKMHARDGADTTDERLVRLKIKRAGTSLCGQRNRGIVKSRLGSGHGLLWEIA